MTSNQDELKRAAAEAAVAYVPDNVIVGVGTGSTVNHFIDALARIKGRIEGAVASSEASAQRLKALGIPLYALHAVNELPVYIDGADEINPHLQMIKGGGAALTREKIIAAVAEKFICIADASKYVRVLGAFPLPVEVIPMARSHVARELVKLGGTPVLREGCITDNGNHILDIHNFIIAEANKMETAINQIEGVVANGIFAHRRADVLLLAGADGVITHK